MAPVNGEGHGNWVEPRTLGRAKSRRSTDNNTAEWRHGNIASIGNIYGCGHVGSANCCNNSRLPFVAHANLTANIYFIWQYVL